MMDLGLIIHWNLITCQSYELSPEKGVAKSFRSVWVCWELQSHLEFCWELTEFEVCVSFGNGEYCLSPVSGIFLILFISLCEKMIAVTDHYCTAVLGQCMLQVWLCLSVWLHLIIYHLNLTNIDLTKRFYFYFIIICNKKSGDRLGGAAMGAPFCFTLTVLDVAVMLPCLGWLLLLQVLSLHSMQEKEGRIECTGHMPTACFPHSLVFKSENNNFLRSPCRPLPPSHWPAWCYLGHAELKGSLKLDIF